MKNTRLLEVRFLTRNEDQKARGKMSKFLKLHRHVVIGFIKGTKNFSLLVRRRKSVFHRCK